jgi:hypothetical protein
MGPDPFRQHDFGALFFEAHLLSRGNPEVVEGITEGKLAAHTFMPQRAGAFPGHRTAPFRYALSLVNYWET